MLDKRGGLRHIEFNFHYHERIETMPRDILTRINRVRALTKPYYCQDTHKKNSSGRQKLLDACCILERRDERRYAFGLPFGLAVASAAGCL